MQETLKTTVLLLAALMAIGLAFLVAGSLLLVLAVAIPTVIAVATVMALLSGEIRIGRGGDSA